MKSLYAKRVCIVRMQKFIANSGPPARSGFSRKKETGTGLPLKPTAGFSQTTRNRKDNTCLNNTLGAPAFRQQLA